MTDSPHIDSPSLQQVRETRTSPSNSLPSPVAQSSNAQLASLLAAALNDVETLRRELVATKKRAEDAERRCHAFSSVSDPKSTQADTARIIQDFDQRALEAEAARDDSDSRRRALIDTWHQLDRYLQMVEVRAADARAGFQKIVTDGGGQLVLNSLPTFYSTVGSMAPPPNHSRALYSSSGRSHGHRSSQSQSGFPPLPLPPHPTPNGNGRRPRDESLDRSGYSDTVPGQPPHKKLKSYGGDDRRGRDERTAYSENNLAYMHRRHQPLPPQTIDSRDRIYVERRVPQPRMIVPPGGEATDYANHRGRSHSRSSSRSSRSSLSLDEMLLLATGEGANGAGGPAEAVSQRASHRRRHHPREDQPSHRYPPSNEPSIQLQHHSQSQQQQRTPDDSSPTQTQPFVPQNYRTRAPHTSASVQPVAENHVNAGVPAAHHVQTIQTHVFAPVVTGAPIKKVKGGSVSNLTTSGTGPGEAPPATPQHIYPPTNAQGQRICRQCGMAGRYKEGKCVEKWGPGPMGPGTVCDRCRKKMKRVERRGNLEAANSLNNVNALQQPQQTQPIPPRNVLQQTQSGTIHRTDTLISTTTQQQQQSSHSDRARDRDRDRDNRDRDESDARTALVAAVSGSGTGGGSNHHHSNTSSHRASTSAAVAALPSVTHSSHPTTRQSHLPSPPPAIASINDELPTSNVGRGVTTRGQHSQHSRPQSRNSRNERPAPAPAPVASTVAAAPVTTTVPSVLTTSKCSPLASARDGSRGASEGDPDADADADADAEAEGEVETEIEGASGDQDGTSQVEGEISLEGEGGGLDEEDDEILAAAGV
ncbi:hypothetical protein JOM56_015256 [Amanita muscaria]